jgi:hypothetical protein
MDKKEFAEKTPMASPGFTVITPKEETEYDKMIREKQEAQLEGCCEGGWQSRYDYAPRPTTPVADTAPEPQDAQHRDAPQTDKKSSKR